MLALSVVLPITSLITPEANAESGDFETFAESYTPFEKDDPKNSDFFLMHATLTGNVNGGELAAKGEGHAIATGGELSLVYTFSKTPEDFDKHVLSAFVITGIPRAVKAERPAVNPFYGFGGTKHPLIEYDRKLVFESGETLNFKAHCERRDDGNYQNFHLTGTMPSGAKFSDEIEPLTESWIQSDDDHTVFYGSFPMTWTDARTGKKIRAASFTTYKIHDPHIPVGFPTQQRYVTIQSAVKGNTYSQNQESTLYASLPGHEARLRKIKTVDPRLQ